MTIAADYAEFAEKLVRHVSPLGVKVTRQDDVDAIMKLAHDAHFALEYYSAQTNDDGSPAAQGFPRTLYFKVNS